MPLTANERAAWHAIDVMLANHAVGAIQSRTDAKKSASDVSWFYDQLNAIENEQDQGMRQKMFRGLQRQLNDVCEGYMPQKTERVNRGGGIKTEYVDDPAKQSALLADLNVMNKAVDAAIDSRAAVATSPQRQAAPQSTREIRRPPPIQVPGASSAGPSRTAAAARIGVAGQVSDEMLLRGLIGEMNKNGKPSTGLAIEQEAKANRTVANKDGYNAFITARGAVAAAFHPASKASATEKHSVLVALRDATERVGLSEPSKQEYRNRIAAGLEEYPAPKQQHASRVQQQQDAMRLRVQQQLPTQTRSNHNNNDGPK